MPELVGVERPDLVLINDDDLTYAKIRLDPHSLQTAITSIGSFTSSLPAALVWAATWDMVRDGEMAARDYVRLVLGGVDSVRDISVVQTLLRQASLAARQYADPSWRSRGTGLHRLRRSGRCSRRPRQARTTSSPMSARSPPWRPQPGDLEFLAGLLDGTVSLDGLAVDTDLRWSLLRRLVSRGVRGEEAIDAELSRDATDAGERQASGCRAAIPTLTAKRETWETLTDGKLTIAMFRATISGFADPGPARARPAVPAGVLRRARRGMAGLVLGHGAGLRGVRLLHRRGRLIDDRGHRRLPGQRPSRRPHCAACSSRAGTRSRAPCATRRGTASGPRPPSSC